MEYLGALWLNMIDVGYNIRKSRADGQAAWQPYKNKYANYVFENGDRSIPLKASFLDKIRGVNYKFTDWQDETDATLIISGIVLDNRIETHHFIIQHFRIPSLEKCDLSVVKIAQLAYNIGQAKAVIECEKVYDPQILEFYKKNHLNEITTYIFVYHQNMYVKN